MPKIDFNRLWACNVGNPMLTFGNKWGYRLNVNNEVIRPLYEKYRKEVLGNRLDFPPSDSERLDFEDRIIPYLIRNGFLKFEI